MKTNLLKLQRKCPFWFDVFYGHALRIRKSERSVDRMIKVLRKLADELYGWEDEREVYDAAIISTFLLLELRKDLHDELD